MNSPLSGTRAPAYIRCSPGEVTPAVILVGDAARLALFEAALDQPSQGPAEREFRVLRGRYGELPVMVVSTGLGGPATAIAVEELARMGARLFVRAGTAMAIQVAVGELVLAQAAVRAEGTSRTYAPLPYPAVADAGAYAAFRQALQALGHPWAEGVVLSTDGFFSRMLHDGEPPAGDDGWDEATLARWRILSLDMETAALYVVARHLGVAAVSLCMATVDRRHGAAPAEVRAGYEQTLVRATLEGVHQAITQQQEAQP